MTTPADRVLAALSSTTIAKDRIDELKASWVAARAAQANVDAARAELLKAKVAADAAAASFRELMASIERG